MAEILKHKNLGKFFIKKELINDKLDKVREVMSHMVVIEARHNAENNRFDYVAISDLFEKVKEGTPISGYELYYEGKNLKARKVS